MHHIIKEGYQLYRYDLEEPPEKWDSNFHNNHINYYDKDLEYKNQAALNFFVDSFILAKNMAKYVCENRSMGSYFITTCEVSKDLALFDLTDYKNIFSMLEIIEKAGLDVLNDSFKINGTESTFKDWSQHYKNAKSQNDNIAIYKSLQRFELPKGITMKDGWYFGQMLTDFQNGKIFKRLLRKSGYNGYMWDESKKQNDEITYCILESQFLTSPSSTEFELD